jgi:perosamine synthetase
LTNKEVIEALRLRGIDSRPFFHPLSSLPAYQAFGGAEKWRRRNPVSYDIAPRGICLPSGFNLTEALVRQVVEAVEGIIGGRV